DKKDVIVEDLAKVDFQGVDIAFFAGGGTVSKEYAPKAQESGAIVIDNSSAFRMIDSVPLVVPEVNEEALKHHNGLIANPNCSTIQMVLALLPLAKEAGLKRV